MMAPIGADGVGGEWSILVYQTKFNIIIYREILEAFMFPSADKLYM